MGTATCSCRTCCRLRQSPEHRGRRRPAGSVDRRERDDAGASISGRRRGAVSGHPRSAAYGTPARHASRRGRGAHLWPVARDGRWTNVRIAAGTEPVSSIWRAFRRAATTRRSTTSLARARSRFACRRRPRQSCSWGRSNARRSDPPFASAHRIGLAAAIVVGWSSRAEAACTISASGINFGTYSVFSATPDDATGTVTVDCSTPTTMSR